MIYDYSGTVYNPIEGNDFATDLFNMDYEGFDILDPSSENALFNGSNIDVMNFPTGSVSFDNVIDTGDNTLISQMTQQGAQYDELIAEQEALLPNITSQIYTLQAQMAQNPELRAALYPMYAQLRQQQQGIQDLVDSRTDMMDNLSSIYDSMAEGYEAAAGNIKDAANTVGNLSSIIGDINVGEGIDDSSV